jgi:acetoin utilization deacetylase AcuC-like enzyme
VAIAKINRMLEKAIARPRRALYLERANKGMMMSKRIFDGDRNLRRRSFLKTVALTAALPVIPSARGWTLADNATYRGNIRLYYRPEMALETDSETNFSKSPLKPLLFVEFLKKKHLLQYFEIVADWPPFEREDFLIAHTERYVSDFFDGKEPLASSNGLAWSEQFADSVRYTNASLYYAIYGAVKNPAAVSLSPSSGFHHATPRAGSGFCTFSGQVIASVKLYRQWGLSGAYIDLDGHYGNSIEDSRPFVRDLKFAIPPGCNINPSGKNSAYLRDLRDKLRGLRELLLADKIHYVVYPHGGDSHEWDDLGGQCTTKEWMHASRLVYTMVREVSHSLSRPIPLVMALFGGYRDDDYDSVLSLHAADAALCLSVLCGRPLAYRPEVKKPA